MNELIIFLRFGRSWHKVIVGEPAVGLHLSNFYILFKFVYSFLKFN
jgi:hypothetical protein